MITYPPKVDSPIFIMDNHYYRACLIYYLRKKAFYEALEIAQTAYTSTQIDDYKFWEGYCLHKMNQKNEALDIFQEIEGKSTATNSLISRVKSGVRDQKQQSNDNTLAQLLLIDVLEGQVKKGEVIVKQLSADNNHFVLLVMAIYEISKGNNPKNIAAAANHIKKADELKPNNPLCTLLQIEIEVLKKNTTAVPILLSDLESMKFDRKLILIEKCYIAIIGQNWEFLSSLLDTISLEAPDNLLGLKCSLVYCLVVSGDSAKTNDVFLHALHTIDRIYYSDPLPYIIDIIELVHCIGAENASVLKNSIKTLEKLWPTNKESYELAIQLGYAYLLLQQPKKAADYYKQASKLQQTKQEPIVKLVMCSLMADELDEAESSLDFVKEVFSSLQGDDFEILFLHSILSFKRARDARGKQKDDLLRESNNFFDKALKQHLNVTKGMLNDFDFFKAFNPSLLLLIARFFMVGSELSYLSLKLKLQQLNDNNFIHNKCTKILEIILSKIPGLLAGYIILAKASLLHGDLDAAKNYVSKVLAKDNLNQESYYFELFIALINSNQNTKHIQKTLQGGLSANFELLNNPGFMFLKAEAETIAENYEEAAKSLEKAKNLAYKQNSSDQLKIEIEIGMAMLNTKMLNYSAANDEIMDLIVNYGTTKHAQLIIIANSEIKLLQGDTKTAIGVLQNVDASTPAYVPAKMKLADIYLNQLKLSRAYVQCYAEIYKALGDKQSHYSYAMALEKVQNYDNALVIYREIEKEKDSEEIALRIGNCLTKMHNFVEALVHYEKKLEKFNKSLSLLTSLCNLYEKFGKTTRIEQLINVESLQAYKEENAQDLIEAMLILHRLYINPKNKEHNFEKAIECLNFCIEVQRKEVEKSKENNTDVDVQRKRLSRIHTLFVEGYSKIKFNSDDILAHLEEALKNDPDNLALQIKSAEVYFTLKNFDLSKEKSRKVLKSDFLQPDALQLLADCLQAALQPVNGIKGFSKILEKQILSNSSYHSIVQLIWFYRNAGKLGEFKHKLDSLKKQLQGSGSAALDLVFGLYNYFIRNYNTALEYLFKSLKYASFSKLAILVMLDIYIHPYSYPLYSNFFHKEKLKLPERESIDSVQKLVDLLLVNGHDNEYALYSVILEFIADPLKIDHSITTFEQILKNPAYSIYQSLILYYLAIFFLKTKNKEKLKATFISIRQLTYHPYQCYDEYFFKSQLLCADTLLSKEKYKPAKLLIDNCMAANKNCLAAYEYLYLLYDKTKEDNLYLLETAFELTNKEDPNIGYRFAKRLMEDEKWVESFKICKIVQDKYPKFKEIDVSITRVVKQKLLDSY